MTCCKGCTCDRKFRVGDAVLWGGIIRYLVHHIDMDGEIIIIDHSGVPYLANKTDLTLLVPEEG